MFFRPSHVKKYSIPIFQINNCLAACYLNIWLCAYVCYSTFVMFVHQNFPCRTIRDHKGPYGVHTLRACHIKVKIHFSWKLIMGSEKIRPFDVQSMGNISDFHFEPSDLHFFQFFKFQNPFISPKKNSFDYWVYGTQNDRLEPRVSTQKSGLKNMHWVPRY